MTIRLSTMVRDRGVLAVLALAVLLAGSATLFGFAFAPEGHEHEAEEAQMDEVGAPPIAHGAGDPGHAHGESAAPEEGHTHGTAAREEDEAGAGAVAAAILIGIAGGALSPLSARLGRRLGRPPDEEVSGDRMVMPGGPLPVLLATLSAGAAAIHFAVIAQHWDEWWLTGAFFLALGLFQLIWALLVLARPSATLYLAGAVVNAAVIAIWVVSRTTGVPIGPEAGEPEAIGFPDALSTAFEALIVTLAVLVVARPRSILRRWRPAPAARWLLPPIVASLTAVALTVLV